jgi:hypothetical protein
MERTIGVRHFVALWICARLPALEHVAPELCR